ncbi:EF-hand domain-containing protein [Bradyrhizobium canariense]|uniref:EF-hand domain pair n=1 Tax=Bradyrhizobium canariense TaxID=255045 RepID=A0A1H1QSC6_9BRAD|nr:EF-hand domain-containing protein [Bradyrhizobium canariense]SDS26334.1 EF-hand domain pair [Bradyrhizobium canariense]
MSNIAVICRIAVIVGLSLASVPLALAQPAPVKSGPDVWDANHDGVYTCDEWKNYLDRLFTMADRNHDGHLDASEFAIVRRTDATLADADFDYFDENQDGKITRNELVSKPSEFIMRFDRNGDCRVTPDEMKPVENPNAPKERPRDRWH